MYQQPEADIHCKLMLKSIKILVHANKASKACLYLVLALSSR